MASGIQVFEFKDVFQFWLRQFSKLIAAFRGWNLPCCKPIAAFWAGTSILQAMCNISELEPAILQAICSLHTICSILQSALSFLQHVGSGTLHFAGHLHHLGTGTFHFAWYVHLCATFGSWNLPFNMLVGKWLLVAVCYIVVGSCLFCSSCCNCSCCSCCSFHDYL